MAPRPKRAAAKTSEAAPAKKVAKKASPPPKEEQPEPRKAAQIHSELGALAPEHSFSLVLNEDGKPRRGAFEISVAKAGESEKVLVWSGLPKGPPRKDKFPEAEAILADVLKALK
ncbi:hypothetical protein pipiens_018878 [Culex pipiens pipiens]|uniref:Selenoprotein BthD n=1 Tax=Culex pipiens pipiens TaxID=38569 RepID=A0ABD1DXI3_CULPP